MASIIDLRISKERYAEMIREHLARHPTTDPDGAWPYAIGMLVAVAKREGHTEELDIIEALSEVLGWTK